MYKVSRLRMFAVIFSSLALQMTLARYLAIGGVKPDLVIMCVIFFGLFYGRSAGFEAGLAGGFLQDVFALDFFGLNTFLGGVTGLIAGAVSSQISGESKIFRGVLVGILTGISMAIHYILATALSPYHALGFGEYLTGTIMPGSIATGIVSVIAILRFARVFTVKERDEFL